MTAWERLGASLENAFLQVGERLASTAPNLLGAVALLLAGWLAARLLRGGAVRLIGVLELLLYRLSRTRGVEPPRIPSATAEGVGSVLFWVVILFFAAAATHVLGLDVFSSWLAGLVAYVPTLAAGVLIILAGVLLSGLARDLTAATLSTLSEAQRALLARIVQITILTTAVVIGADQIGVKITFLVILAAVVMAAMIGGVALAVSLGARAYVANLIGAHYLRQAFGVGQRIRVAGLEGTILDLTPVSIVLEAEEGRITVPAKVFNEEPIVLLTDRGEEA
ncbi:MAG: hypothetical protein KatS3mg123_2251 [Burkholderiales bacterium]|nr:MAG: hypothetical protein KatS3mg123_2251 [Burkholderiales bacterium]